MSSEGSEIERDKRDDLLDETSEQQEVDRVRQLWEELQDHQLSPERARDFAGRPEVRRLAELTTPRLRAAAADAMRRNNGRLTLSEWVRSDEKRKAVTLADPDGLQLLARWHPAYPVHPAPEVQVCSSCGSPIDGLGHCRCS